ncbi:MAG: DUF1049 domain-containing protein [Chloroflexi bacterium]|nr:DUF1049 domain-containing protein [Chloroflexota bacterium]
MLQVFVFLALAFSIVIAIFAVQNTVPVAVTFLVLRADGVAVSVLVLVSAALGAGVMLLLGVAREVRLQLRHRSLGQQLKRAEARIRELESQAASSVNTDDPAMKPALAAPESESAPLPGLAAPGVPPPSA